MNDKLDKYKITTNFDCKNHSITLNTNVKDIENMMKKQKKIEEVSPSFINDAVNKFNKLSDDLIIDYNYEKCFTITKNGSVGYCFYHDYKFCCTTDVIVLKLINDYSIDKKIFTSIITKKFTNGDYNYNRKLNRNRLENETIILPVDEHGNMYFSFN